jgi:DNA-directed RNA polymerase subunit RPC12/RpoP
MSAKCLGKNCVICRRTIDGANYFCVKCGACVCFYCGAEMLKEAKLRYLKCPRCGANFT